MERSVDVGLKDEEYWNWLLAGEGVVVVPRHEQTAVTGDDTFRLLIERYGGRLGARVVWTYFEYVAEIKLWHEYARLRDSLYRDKVLVKPHKNRDGLVVGHRRVTEARSLGLDEACYEVVVEVPDCVKKLRLGSTSVRVVENESGNRVVTASIAQIEPLGKGIGLKIQDAWKGRGMRRKWTCGCEEFRNRRGDSVLSSDCGDERGCEVRNYYRFRAFQDVNVTFI